MVFRDSMILIQQVNKVKENDEQISTSIPHQIKLLLDKFDLMELFHVKRNVNMMENSLANQGTLLEQGVLKIDKGDFHTNTIP